MSSKGIDFYSINHVPGVIGNATRTRLQVMHGNGPVLEYDQRSNGGAYQHGHIEVDDSGLGLFESSKQVRLSVHCGDEVFGLTQLIDTKWPKLPDGPLSDTFATYSRTGVSSPGGALSISYGFADTSGLNGISDVMYLHVTPDYRTWMGDLAAARPDLHDRPFTEFVLPGAHDAGMFEPDKDLEHLLHKAGLLTGFGANAIRNSAFTQKDDVTTMLDLGTRYFDFRPGALFSDTSICHVHSVVPGVSLHYFLRATLQWLAAHPTEIAVVRLIDSGIHDMFKVSAQDVEAVVASAFDGVPVRRGGTADLIRTVGDLLSSNTRLILTYGTDDCYSSWNDKYETDDPAVILEQLAEVSATKRPTTATHTVLELQTSATKAGLAYGAKNTAAGELIRTKPVFNHVLYPWIRTNVPVTFPDGLVVLLDDFVDGARPPWPSTCSTHA